MRAFLIEEVSDLKTHIGLLRGIDVGGQTATVVLPDLQYPSCLFSALARGFFCAVSLWFPRALQVTGVKVMVVTCS